jgi:hypothetical protein
MKFLSCCATARANKSIGKRLTLSFPKAIDQRVMVLAMPDEGHVAFGVRKIEGGQHELLMFTQMASAAESEKRLALFADEAAALSALGRVRRALTRPLRRALGWALVALMASLVIQWAIDLQPSRGAGGNVSAEQLAALQQAMAARQGVVSLPMTLPPTAPTAAPPSAAPAAQGESGGASIYSNPAQPQDPTGGAVTQLMNSR